MLVELYISNFALIDSLRIQFNKGLNILTGETGAGKSIIIDALGLVLGQRANRDSIRQGEKKMIVEAQFQVFSRNKVEIENTLKDHGIDIEEDNIVIMSREVMANGKNTCRVNGRMVPVSMMRQLSSLLIDIHGQHEHQSLLHWESHKALLDSYGGTQIQELLTHTKNYYHKFKKTQRLLDELIQDEMQMEREKDILNYQLEEIDKGQLKENEDEELEGKRNLLIHGEKIFQNATKAYDLLYGGSGIQKSTYDQLSESINCVEKISQYDANIKTALEQLNNAYVQIEDVSFMLRDYSQSIEFDPSELDEIEKRLSIINNLKRKYGSSIKEILLYKEELENRLSKIENKKHKEEELQKEKENHWTNFIKYAKRLSSTRKKIAEKFEEKIIKELKDLGMDKVQFKVNIQSSEEYASETGMDRVEFLLSPNVGQSLRPLAKIASGGEISRIMLALKTILADVDQIDTLIFDEIDTGISGRTAQVVAEKMAFISKSYQIICITHLPQIASMADAHYLIEKKQKNQQTNTVVYLLNVEEQIQELGRMLGGATLTQLTLSHSRQILEMAEKTKKLF